MVYWSTIGQYWEIGRVTRPEKNQNMIDSANPEIWYFRSCFNSFSRMSSNLRPKEKGVAKLDGKNDGF
jgi:hypothetical protein